MVKISPVKNVGAGTGQIFKQETDSNENELKTVKAGTGIGVSNDTSEVTISTDLDEAIAASGNASIPVINDGFTDGSAKPFWEDTEMFTSGDWSFYSAGDRLVGNLETNQSDWYRLGIEGDADHAFKFSKNSAYSIGMWFIGNSISVSLKYIAGDIEFHATGRTDIDTTVALSDPFWFRLVRIQDDIYGYYKQNDSDDWILVGTFGNINLEHDMAAELDSANTAFIHQAILYDNVFNGSPTRSKFVKQRELAGNSTPIAVDASFANLFVIELSTNATLSTPTNPKPGQMIVFRITQDATGGRTLAYAAGYRFSTDIPSPSLSTAANAVDYLGFIYNDADDKWDCIGKVFGF